MTKKNKNKIKDFFKALWWAIIHAEEAERNYGVSKMRAKQDNYRKY